MLNNKSAGFFCEDNKKSTGFQHEMKVAFKKNREKDRRHIKRTRNPAELLFSYLHSKDDDQIPWPFHVIDDFTWNINLRGPSLATALPSIALQ